MTEQETGVLERLAAAGLEKCLLKIAKVSGGEWRLGDTRVSTGTLAEAVSLHKFKDPAAAAVYIHVQDRFPFISLMFFELEDVAHIAKCFVGGSLPAAGASVPRFDEEMLLELGNIILNAIINYLQNTLKKSAIPSVPLMLKGDAGYIAEGLGAHVEPRQNFRIIVSPVSVHGDSRVSRGEVLTIIPLDLAAALAS
ncbi:MAG: hypothetical protein WCK76_06680 [Elusimicrobiota bacterium]